MARRNRRKQKTPEPSSSEESSEERKEETSEEELIEEAEPLEETDIRQIAFEQIWEQYWYGMYGTFVIIINIITGFINATHICKLATKEFGIEKKYSKWSKSGHIQELMHAMKTAGQNSPTVLEEYVDIRKPKGIMGTYIYLDLFPHLASWCSPTFAMMASKIINEHVSQRYFDISEEKRILGLKEKDDAHAKLTRSMNRKFAAQKAETDRILAAIGFVQDQNVSLKVQNNGLERHLVTIKKKLRITSIDRVMHTDDNNDHNVLAIVVNGSIFIDPNADDSEDLEEPLTPPHDLSAIRAANGNVTQQLKRIRKKYPEAKIWKRTDCPNSNISWKYFVQKYGKHIIRKGREFSLAPGYTMERLWRHLQRCDQSKMKDCE